MIIMIIIMIITLVKSGIWIPKGCCFLHSKFVNKKCLSWKHGFQFGQAESLETKKGAWVLEKVTPHEN